MSDTRGTRSNQAPAHLMFDFMQMLPQEYYEITIKFIFHIKFKYSLIPWRVPHLLLKIDIVLQLPLVVKETLDSIITLLYLNFRSPYSPGPTQVEANFDPSFPQQPMDQFDQFFYKSTHIGQPLDSSGLPPEVNIEVPSDSDSSRRPSKYTISNASSCHDISIDERGVQGGSLKNDNL